MARKKLSEKNAISTALETAYIHVAQGSNSYKITKANFQKSLTSGFKGSLAIADTPTEDGYYIAEQSGTYTNAGSLVVDLTSYLTFIVVSDSQTTFSKVEVTLRRLVFDTVADMVAGTVSAGEVVTTLGYTSLNDGGGNVYQIVDAVHTQDYGAKITISGNVHAVALNTENLTNRHFGIFSDSTTNWVFTAVSRFNGMLDAAVLYGITLESPSGTYFNCQLNLDESHSGAKIHFKDAVFSDLIHIVGTDINNKLENCLLTGHVTTYDRYGQTWTKNILGGLNITIKSNPSIHPDTVEGRGVHIYHTNNNVHYGSIVIENTETTGADNVEAAFALDGEESGSTREAPTGVFIESVWVQDCNVRGVQITGTGHWIGTIRVDRFGSDTFDDGLPYFGTTSYTSETVSQIAQGVLIYNSDCKIDQIIVDQKDGFTGRSRAVSDVVIGKYLFSADPTNNITTYPTIGKIISRNPQRQAVVVGDYQQLSGATIGDIQIEAISSSNILEVNASGERALYGLVDCYYGSVEIGKLYCADALNAVILMQRDVYSTGTQRQNVSVHVGLFHTPHINGVSYTGYNIFQGKLDYILCWNDINGNNKSDYKV